MNLNCSITFKNGNTCPFLLLGHYLVLKVIQGQTPIHQKHYFAIERYLCCLSEMGGEGGNDIEVLENKFYSRQARVSHRG